MKYHNIPTLFDNQASLINGKNIGTDSVRYIQDAGQKTAGTTYIDRNTNELYVCVTTTNSVNNDGNFSKFNLKEAFNKLDNLNEVIVEYAAWNKSSHLDIIRYGRIVIGSVFLYNGNNKPAVIYKENEIIFKYPINNMIDTVVPLFYLTGSDKSIKQMRINTEGNFIAHTELYIQGNALVGHFYMGIL